MSYNCMEKGASTIQLNISAFKCYGRKKVIQVLVKCVISVFIPYIYFGYFLVQ